MDYDRTATNRSRDELFAVIDEMREAFADVPPEEIERNAVAIGRQLRQADEAAIEREEQTIVESTPKSISAISAR